MNRKIRNLDFYISAQIDRKNEDGKTIRFVKKWSSDIFKEKAEKWIIRVGIKGKYINIKDCNCIDGAYVYKNLLYLLVRTASKDSLGRTIIISILIEPKDGNFIDVLKKFADEHDISIDIDCLKKCFNKIKKHLFILDLINTPSEKINL